MTHLPIGQPPGGPQHANRRTIVGQVCPPASPSICTHFVNITVTSTPHKGTCAAASLQAMSIPCRSSACLPPWLEGVCMCVRVCEERKVHAWRRVCVCVCVRSEQLRLRGAQPHGVALLGGGGHQRAEPHSAGSHKSTGRLRDLHLAAVHQHGAK
jgi:hypothetical protein